MINSETSFPHPGSIAEHDGLRCRVIQLLPQRMALLSLIDLGTVRRADLADLFDPSELEDAVLAALERPSETDKQRALWIARHLRNANEVRIADLDTAMWRAARDGHVITCNDRRHLASLIRKLGWSFDRPRQLYVRAPLAKAA